MISNSNLDRHGEQYNIKAGGVNFRFDNRYDFLAALKLFIKKGITVTSHSNTDITNKWRD